MTFRNPGDLFLALPRLCFPHEHINLPHVLRYPGDILLYPTTCVCSVGVTFALFETSADLTILIMTLRAFLELTSLRDSINLCKTLVVHLHHRRERGH